MSVCINQARNNRLSSCVDPFRPRGYFYFFADSDNAAITNDESRILNCWPAAAIDDARSRPSLHIVSIGGDFFLCQPRCEHIGRFQEEYPQSHGRNDKADFSTVHKCINTMIRLYSSLKNLGGLFS